MSPTVAVAIGAAVLALVLQASRAAAQPAGGPQIIPAQPASLEANAALRDLIASVRAQSDALVVLAGGATKMTEAKQAALLGMFDALVTLAGERRIAVGDGGTKAGIMEVAGRARLASGKAFPLIGVSPAREIQPLGATPFDPNHSHIVAVDDPVAASDAASWGSETRSMYWLFARIAAGRPSVAVIANGGGIALTEIAANIEAGRTTILIEGSGRAADAVIALVRGTTPADGEVLQLQNRARAAKLDRRPELFRVVSIEAGAAGLLDALRAALGPAPARAK
jgi:hypothetical protein